MKNKKGFVVSAVLYPLLVLFLAIIMGLLSMTDTRKRILDKMKLEITDNIFDDAACSCDTILAKLNYIIANGTGGSGGGSYSQNTLSLNVKAYETASNLPIIGNNEGDIAVITSTKISNYYVASTPPKNYHEGTVWIVMGKNTGYYIQSDYSCVPISYILQYENDKWELKMGYVYNTNKWDKLNYVDDDSYTWKYEYTGKYQSFTAPYHGYYRIELWGSQGGSGGALGAYTSGEIYLSAGDTFYIYVGGYGYNGATINGGGATDIRTVKTTSETAWQETNSLNSRIMVAAGGSGKAECGLGGAGGGLVGYNGTCIGNGSRIGAGGNQYSGGLGASGDSTGGSGGFGYGGTSGKEGTSQITGGGGGGWYGGGGAAGKGGTDPSGGGGSSYISGHFGCNSVDSTGMHTGSAFSYTGFYFKNTKMIDGMGYLWTNKKDGYIGMPNKSHTLTVKGNEGTGYAQITLLSYEWQSDTSLQDYKNESEKIRIYYSNNYYQEFEAIYTGKYKIELYGSGSGSKGAYTSGEIELKKGTKLYVYVGNHYGFNGSSTNGGGATDIRTQASSTKYAWSENISLRSRIMVAAGGGGSSECGLGGAGGGLIGYSGTCKGAGTRVGSGGTQTSGGVGAIGDSTGKSGGFGFGGDSGYEGSGRVNGGGGGGWYGGGGATGKGGSDPSSGGGSSYISGHAGCIAVDKNGNSVTSSYSNIKNSYSWTNYIFSNTKMIDGAGYNWATVKGAKVDMPTFDNVSTMVGNSSDGYAKITYLD